MGQKTLKLAAFKAPPENESSVVIPPKHTMGGLGVSALFHVGLVAILSLIVLAAEQKSPDLVAFARFEDEGDSESLELTPDVAQLNPPASAELLVQPASLTDFAAASIPAPDPLPALAGIPGLNGPGGEIAEIAEGIQQKVKAAGGARGEVQFSLAWHSFNDLDLHVIVPSGEHISYQHPRSACNGELDVDMNVQPVSESPVENVRWLAKQAPMGRYTIIVHQYRWGARNRIDPFELLVNRGDDTELVKGSVGLDGSISVHRFHYIRPSLSASRKKKLAEEFQRDQEAEEKKAQKILETALPMEPGNSRVEQLTRIIRTFPHTDASLRAMQELQGNQKVIGP
ncbi:MAG: hypothetical protein JNL58_20915 [Planctomyces sp.]|nr:hypothetical protein [Planctomyces sp.]